MKKIILTLLATIAALSVDAQIIEVKRDGTVEAIYGSDVTVNFRAKKIDVPGKSGSYERNFIAEVDDEGSKKSNGKIDQGWVQLWAGGPKFATTILKANSSNYNIGYDFIDTNGDAVTYYWGPNWRTPTLAEIATMIGLCKLFKSYESPNSYGFIKIQSRQENDKYVYIYSPVTSGDYLNPTIWTSTVLSDDTPTTKRFNATFKYSTSGDYSFNISALGEGTSCLILPVLNE